MTPRQFAWRCVVVGVLSLLLELATAGYLLALANEGLVTACLMSGIIPFIAMWQCHWFIRAKTVKRRLILTGAVAVGYVAGTWVAVSVDRWWS